MKCKRLNMTISGKMFSRTIISLLAVWLRLLLVYFHHLSFLCLIESCFTGVRWIQGVRPSTPASPEWTKNVDCARYSVTKNEETRRLLVVTLTRSLLARDRDKTRAGGDAEIIKECLCFGPTSVRGRTASQIAIFGLGWSQVTLTQIRVSQPS